MPTEYFEARERALLGKVGQEAGEELADYAQSVYRTILSVSCSYQNERMGAPSTVYEASARPGDHALPLSPAAHRGLPGN